MKRRLVLLLAICLTVLLVLPVSAALPAGTGVITNSSHVSGSEFSSRSSIAKKLNQMFAGDIGLYKDKKKTKLVDAALGTSNVPNNGVWQYWGKEPRAGTSCYAYANAFYGTFYDGTYPHGGLNGNHTKVKATGKISYENFVKWGVRSDAAVYIREGNHSFVVLQYDENYITYIDGNGNGRGLIALRKEAWKRGSGTNIYNSKPSLIVQPKESYFSAGSMGKKQAKPCTEGGTSHDWDAGMVTKEPTCKEKGVKTYTCADCGKTKEEAVSKTTDHTYGTWIVTKEATCTKSGVETATCEICGKEKTKKRKSLGHDYGKSVTVQEATIYSQGVKEKTCSRCEKVTTVKTACTFRDKELGITLTAKKKVFPKETQIVTGEEAVPEEIRLALQDVTGKISLYAISAYVEEESVQPDGKVTLELDIPQDFGENLSLYAVTEDGVLLLETTLEDGTMAAEVESLGLFALCDLDVPFVPAPTETEPPATEPVTEPSTEPATKVATEPVTVAAVQQKTAEVPEEDSLLLLCILAAVPVAICVGLVIFFVVEKRKKEEVPTE